MCNASIEEAMKILPGFLQLLLTVVFVGLAGKCCSSLFYYNYICDLLNHHNYANTKIQISQGFFLICLCC